MTQKLHLRMLSTPLRLLNNLSIVHTLWRILNTFLVCLPAVFFVSLLVSPFSLQMLFIRWYTSFLICLYVARKVVPQSFHTFARSALYHIYDSRLGKLRNGQWLVAPADSHSLLQKKGPLLRPVMLGIHPHGSSLSTFASILCHPLLSDVTLHVSSIANFFPVNSFIWTLLGDEKVKSNAKEELQTSLSSGQKKVAFIPDGGRETSTVNDIKIKTDDEEFLKVALENNAILIPVWNFAAHHEYWSILGQHVDHWFCEKLGFTPNILIPNWIKGEEQIVSMGHSIDTSKYNTIQELKYAYYEEVKTNFQAQVKLHRKFKNLTLQFTEDNGSRKGSYINMAGFPIIAGIVYIIFQFQSLVSCGQYWLYQAKEPLYHARPIMIHLHSVASLLYWVIGYSQALWTASEFEKKGHLGKKRMIHKILGYFAIFSWLLIAAPTSIYLTFQDSHITGGWFLESMVIINFMETLWNTSVYMYRAMSCVIFKSSPITIEDKRRHGVEMLRALVLSQVIIVPRYLVLILNAFGLDVLNLGQIHNGKKLGYTILNGILLFPLNVIPSYSLIKNGELSPWWVFTRWFLWSLIPILRSP